MAECCECDRLRPRRSSNVDSGDGRMKARTLFEKLWDAHVVRAETADTPAMLYVDLHLVHEVTSPQAFAELQARGLPVRRPERTLATLDHSTPTTPPDD